MVLSPPRPSDLIVIPAPSAVRLDGDATLANTMFLSSIVRTEVLIVVVVPSTVKLPETTRSPPVRTILSA